MIDVSIAFVLPVRNRKAYTLAILRQLGHQITQRSRDETIDVVVVDDGSTDGTAEAIAADFNQVHLISGDGNLWWTGAITIGMRFIQQHLQTDFIIWLNDDITLSDSFIDQLIQICQSNRQQKLITGGIVCDQSHPEWIVFGGVVAGCPINSLQQFSSDSTLGVDALNGNIVVIPTGLMDDIGLPNVDRFRHYGGDYEYICRAKAAGYNVQLSNSLRATTDWQPSDVVRYMPLWVQWYVSRSWADKLSVLKSLTNQKSPHNVEHMVNSIHRQKSYVPRWTYRLFYIKKLVKLFSGDLVPAPMRRKRVEDYFHRNNVPGDVVQAVLR